MANWRDVIRRITQATLVIGGQASVVPWHSRVWIHEQIQGSRLELLEEHEGGEHYPFIENSAKFKRLVVGSVG